MHPLKIALDSLGITQTELVERIRKMNRGRRGAPRGSQSQISAACLGRRGIGRRVGPAIEAALRQIATEKGVDIQITAADLVMWRPTAPITKRRPA